MGTFFGMTGLVLFGLVFAVLGLLIAATAMRSLRYETLPRFREVPPGPLEAVLTLLGTLGVQFVIAGFALAAGLRALQVALRLMAQ